MVKQRLIAVIIVENGRVVQSIRFRHTNAIHSNAINAIEAFSQWSVDEIVLLNVTRSRDSRDAFLELANHVSSECFVPLTIGGWVDTSDYAKELLRRGADKLVVNTAVAQAPELVTELSRRYGAQCIVGSIDVKRNEHGEAQVMVDRGRRAASTDPIGWAKHAVSLGCGEILFNSIDHDGARKGYDLDTLSAICAAVDVPVIAFGGVFTWSHLLQGIEAGADAVAAANIFHYTEQATRRAKSFLAENGVHVRREGQWLN